MKKLLVFMSIAIFAIALGGCRKEAEMTGEPNALLGQEALTEQAAAVTEEVQAEQETPAVAEETPAQQVQVVEKINLLPAVVVTVNGQEITEKEITEEVEKRIEAQKKRMPEGAAVPDSFRQRVRKRAMDMKVEQALLSQEMTKQNISISDEKVLEEIKKIAGQKGQSMEDVEKEIANYGMTLEDLKGQIRSQMQVKALMGSLNPDAVVTEADARKFYDENPQHFNQPAQIKASHILCGKRGIKEEEYPAELEKIEAAKARLDAGEAFEDVAKDVSTCPSKDQGGDLGFFGKGQMDPAFEKAAFALEPGQTTDIVKTSFGYHIIKVTDKKEAGKTSFEEAKEQITQFLTQQKQRAFWGEYNKTMRDSATIEYSEKEQALRDEMEKAAAAQRAARAAQQAAPRPIQPKTEAAPVEAGAEEASDAEKTE